MSKNYCNFVPELQQIPHYMKKIFFLLFHFLIIGSLCAQQKKTVCGETRYVVPETQSLSEAKRTAIERARLQALADEFGTVVTQTNTTAMHTTNGQTNSTFNSFSGNDVRGVWEEDTKEPEIKVLYENEVMVIHAKVCGKARELKSNQVELKIETLSYGPHHGNRHPTRPGEVTTQFRNNDFFGVHFKSPVNGYVALFIRDDNNDIVYTQLPYENSNGSARAVKSNQDYTFLNNQDPEYPDVPAVILTTDRKIENNTLIMVFSKKPFDLSLSEQGKYFQETDLTKFLKWLHNLRKHDETVQVQEIVLTIHQ